MSFDYQTYLASREWALKREAVRQRSSNRCERTIDGQRCVGSQDSVHHLTYARVGNEPLEDLLGVCNDCHRWLSGKTDADVCAQIIAAVKTPRPHIRMLGDVLCEAGIHLSYAIVGQAQEGNICECYDCHARFIETTL